VIPDEAITAAAKELWDVNEHDDVWVDDFSTYDAFLRHKARMALEAAAPYLTQSAQFSAWNEGYKAGEIDGAYQLNGHEEPDQRNPYRKPADV